jgi:uncharacterized membrane protein
MEEMKMNKNQFLNTLRNKLKKLPKDELDSVIVYYTEYFEDASKESEEQKIIEQLGSPVKIAHQIMMDNAIKNIDYEEPSIKKQLSSIWLVILGVFALPVGLPVAVILFALVLSLFVMIFSLFISIVAIGIYGFVLFLFGISLIFFESFASACFFIGSGVAILGLTIALITPFLIISIKFLKLLALKLIKKINKKKYLKSIYSKKGSVINENIN